MKKTTRVEHALIRGLKEALEYERGKKKLKTTHRELPSPAPNWNQDEIRKIRREVLNVSQPAFAVILNVKPPTIRAWEQGKKRPSGAASRLLQIAATEPGLFKRLSNGNGTRRKVAVGGRE